MKGIENPKESSKKEKRNEMFFEDVLAAPQPRINMIVIHDISQHECPAKI